MNKKQWLVAIVLLDFVALNAFVVWQYGYVGFVEAALSNLASVAVMVDLAIAISMIGVWMWNDAKRRGISPIPYLITSLFLGSVGPLAYLLRTLGDREPAVATRLSAGVVAK